MQRTKTIQYGADIEDMLNHIDTMEHYGAWGVRQILPLTGSETVGSYTVATVEGFIVVFESDAS